MSPAKGQIRSQRAPGRVKSLQASLGVSATSAKLQAAWAQAESRPWDLIRFIPAWESEAPDVELASSYPAIPSRCKRPCLGSHARGWQPVGFPSAHFPKGSQHMTQIEAARKGIVTDEMHYVARREDLAPELVRDEV